MSGKEVQERDQGAGSNPSSLSGESREKWVSLAIAAATASLRANAPSADPAPVTSPSD